MSLQKPFFTAVLIIAGSLLGCRSTSTVPSFNPKVASNTPPFQGPSLKIEEPIGSTSASGIIYEPAPLDDFNFNSLESYQLMSLEECIFNALQGSPVLRELGGATLRFPDQLITTQNPSLAYTNPVAGEEAALSAFDAVYNSQLLYQNNDRAFNNTFVGSDGFFGQDLATYRSGISKLTATGASYEFNHGIDYDRNNTPANRFNGTGTSSFSYDSFFEAGFRQPLFQGAGVDFNRIAGPNNAPGVNNGVLIARTNTDISLAEFEAQLRDLVSDVENAYWDLYYSYRDLESRIEARDGAYKTWEAADANSESTGGATVINQAKEQYYRFASEVENSIHGRLNEGTQTNNGSSGGTFRNTLGVRVAERRLRLITGMALNGPQLIVPKDRPSDAEIVFDWEQAKSDAVSKRPELRRQRWQVKRRELELLASRNHLLPRVDFLGAYRVRGFGENLFGSREIAVGANLNENLGTSATETLINGDLQEWELGFDVTVPTGFRRAHAAKRFAELSLARERAVLTEQERHVVFGLSNAMGELKRSSRVRSANRKRLEAAQAQYAAVNEDYKNDSVDIDQVLDAQRRLIEAKTQFYQSQVESMLAVRSVHFEKGTLFQYHNVRMSESAWNGEAYKQAFERGNWKKKRLSYYFPGIAVGKNGSVNSASSSTPSSLGDVVQGFMAKKETKEDKASPVVSKEAFAKWDKDENSQLLAIAQTAGTAGKAGTAGSEKPRSSGATAGKNIAERSKSTPLVPQEMSAKEASSKLRYYAKSSSQKNLPLPQVEGAKLNLSDTSRRKQATGGVNLPGSNQLGEAIHKLTDQRNGSTSKVR